MCLRQTGLGNHETAAPTGHARTSPDRVGHRPRRPIRPAPPLRDPRPRQASTSTTISCASAPQPSILTTDGAGGSRRCSTGSPGTRVPDTSACGVRNVGHPTTRTGAAHGASLLNRRIALGDVRRPDYQGVDALERVDSGSVGKRGAYTTAATGPIAPPRAFYCRSARRRGPADSGCLSSFRGGARPCAG